LYAAASVSFEGADRALRSHLHDDLLTVLFPFVVIVNFTSDDCPLMFLCSSLTRISRPRHLIFMPLV